MSATVQVPVTAVLHRVCQLLAVVFMIGTVLVHVQCAAVFSKNGDPLCDDVAGASSVASPPTHHVQPYKSIGHTSK